MSSPLNSVNSRNSPYSEEDGSHIHSSNHHNNHNHNHNHNHNRGSPSESLHSLRSMHSHGSRGSPVTDDQCDDGLPSSFHGGEDARNAALHSMRDGLVYRDDDFFSHSYSESGGPEASPGDRARGRGGDAGQQSAAATSAAAGSRRSPLQSEESDGASVGYEGYDDDDFDDDDDDGAGDEGGDDGVSDDDDVYG